EKIIKKKAQFGRRVHYVQLYGNDRFTCCLQACENKPHPIVALAFSKFAFAFVSFRCILFGQLFLYLGLLFRWTSEGRAAETDPFFFTVLTVLADSVDLICKDGFRIMTKPAFIPFSRLLKCRTLVVVVPVKVFHQRITIYQADGYLSGKFCAGLGLAAHNRAHMRL